LDKPMETYHTKVELEMVLRKKDKPHGRPGGCVVLNESSEMVQSGEKTLTWLGCGTTSRSSPR
jgi:hypothetical protein